MRSGIAIGVTLALLFACTGDDPELASPNVSDGGTSTSSSGGTSSSSGTPTTGGSFALVAPSTTPTLAMPGETGLVDDATAPGTRRASAVLSTALPTVVVIRKTADDTSIATRYWR